jgi:O-antigen/teichoic acid export membrane protein
VKAFLTRIFSGSARTKVIKKNIIGSFGIKGLSIATSLVLVPLTLHLLDQEKYGIWITIFSIVTWFNMMDIGMGNGFRNKFADALARGERKLGKEYVQTFYSSMAIIALSFLSIFTVINPFLNWSKILNLPTNFDENINLIVWSVFALFCIQLYLKNISTILLALQKTTYSNSLMLMANIGALIFIFILQYLNMISLFSIALAFMSAPVIVFLITTLFTFNGYLKEFKPQLFSLPKKKYLNDLVGLGLKFFFIQITTVVMFSSSNIIITQLYGPSEVTPYNIAFRLFSTVLTVFTIIVTPFWGAFTEAHAMEDFNWIKKSIKKLISIWGLFVIGTFVLWIISPFIFRIWVGREVIIPLDLSLQFAIFTVIMSWTNLFVFYINGVGKIKLQLYIAIFQCIVNIPLAVILAKYLGLGTSGIILATNINMLIPAILIPIQYKKLINNTAHDIWSK